MVFGRNIFSNRNLTFAPNENIATPADYKLGPGDEVIIDIWGTNQNTIRQTITPDGFINVNGIGVVYLSGMTIKEADSYFYGLQTKSSFEYAMENGELLDELYYATPVTSPLTYNGDIFGFQEEFKEDLFLYPGQDYILWIVTYDESGMYTDEDVYTLEINMPRFTGGSSIEVESSLDEVSYTHMQFSLSAQGAQYIYWAIISTEDLYEYPYEEDKVKFIDSKILLSGLEFISKISYNIFILVANED